MKSLAAALSGPNPAAAAKPVGAPPAPKRAPGMPRKSGVSPLAAAVLSRAKRPGKAPKAAQPALGLPPMGNNAGY